jgi:glycine/D-amino acid oxidase-like deaminating enzyme
MSELIVSTSSIPYFHETSAPRFRKAKGEKTTSVVIIGAGIIGVLHAVRLAECGVECILIDGGRVMQGISLHQSGMQTRTFDERYDDILKREGAGLLEERFGIAARAQQWLMATVARVGGECSFRIGDSDYGAYNEKVNLDSLYGLWEGASVANTGAQLLENQVVTSENPFTAMMRFPQEGSYNPVRFAHNALRHYKDMITVFENSPVESVRVRNGNVVVGTADATIYAGHVILATAEPRLLGKGIKRFFYKNWCLSLVLKFPKTVSIPYNRNFFDTPTINCFRRLDDNMVILLGEGPNLSKNEDEEVYLEQLLKLARQLFGNDFEIARKWAAYYVETKDGMPIGGAHPKPQYSEHITLALGGGGTGNVNGSLLAQMNVQRILTGRHDPEYDLFDIARFFKEA